MKTVIVLGLLLAAGCHSKAAPPPANASAPAADAGTTATTTSDAGTTTTTTTTSGGGTTTTTTTSDAGTTTSDAGTTTTGAGTTAAGTTAPAKITPAPSTAPAPSSTSPLPAQPDPGFMPMGVWGDPYRLTGDPTLKGTTLSVPVQYGGGCAKHAFTLKPSPRTADAPTTQQVALHHDAHGDKCKALLRQNVTLDLADLLEDCTRTVVLTVGAGQKGYELKLDPPVGCD